MSRYTIFTFLSMLMLCTGCTLVDNEDNNFPDRPIEIIVGYAAGGGSDTWARTFANEASKTLGVPVTVTNLVGNGGLDALEAFMTRKSDGYTLMSVVDIYAAAFANGDTDINLATDLQPLMIGNIAVSEIFVASDDARFGSWDDVVAYAQSNGTLTVASAGTPRDLEGLSLEILSNQFAINLDRQIIESSANRFNAPVTGTTDLLIEQSADVRQLVTDGLIRPVLSFWNVETSPGSIALGIDHPELPMLLRMRGISAPLDVPPDRLQILQTALDKAFQSDAFQAILSEKGLDVVAYPTNARQAWEDQVTAYQTLLTEN